MTCQHATTTANGLTACAVRNGRTVSPGVCAHCDLTAPEPCPPHADWCERYGLPTDLAQCTTCNAAREAGDAEYLQAMRARGLAYGASACQHREQTGTTTTRTCCGGKAKELPVYRCTRTGQSPAPCARCRDKSPAPSLSS
jgi:hypothetical protein